MTIRSLALLALVLAGAADAGEKPARRAPPVDRNKACAGQGEGFVYSKETNTCIRVGGAVGGQISGGSPGQGFKW